MRSAVVVAIEAARVARRVPTQQGDWAQPCEALLFAAPRCAERAALLRQDDAEKTTDAQTARGGRSPEHGRLGPVARSAAQVAPSVRVQVVPSVRVRDAPWAPAPGAPLVPAGPAPLRADCPVPVLLASCRVAPMPRLRSKRRLSLWQSAYSNERHGT